MSSDNNINYYNINKLFAKTWTSPIKNITKILDGKLNFSTWNHEEYIDALSRVTNSKDIYNLRILALQSTTNINSNGYYYLSSVKQKIDIIDKYTPTYNISFNGGDEYFILNDAIIYSTPVQFHITRSDIVFYKKALLMNSIDDTIYPLKNIYIRSNLYYLLSKITKLKATILSKNIAFYRDIELNGFKLYNQPFYIDVFSYIRGIKDINYYLNVVLFYGYRNIIIPCTNEQMNEYKDIISSKFGYKFNNVYFVITS